MKKIFVKEDSNSPKEEASAAEMNEIEVLKSLNHPNIVKYHDTF